MTGETPEETTRELQLLADYTQAYASNDFERMQAILAVAITNPVLDNLIWCFECEMVKVVSITPEEDARIKALIKKGLKQFEKGSM